jgi:hypothetical protein
MNQLLLKQKEIFCCEKKDYDLYSRALKFLDSYSNLPEEISEKVMDKFKNYTAGELLEYLNYDKR